ncbi:MAG: TonB-dependent receptor [Saprospiraceae bacterium]|nr:TonB-dependent receptor [Saprospiraceae bacterium]
MKRIFTLSLFVFVSLLCTDITAQNTVKGKVVDENTGEGLVGANVMVEGTTIGAITDLDGSFTIKNVSDGEVNFVVSYLGFENKVYSADVEGDTNVGKISLEPAAVGLAEVNVLADVAINRRTPVAVSTISSTTIEEKLGNQEFPEIMKMTPSIYTTKTSGGFGDSRINIRGFAQEDVALLINGIPVNGMEDNKVYWSNWAGLGDVTRTIQVQRGLGASKLAVASVGGTINIITNSTDQRKGGNVFTSFGNDNYFKTGVTLSTGLTENNWAFTFSGSRTTGDGYIDGNYIDAWSYFFSVSKQINEDHLLMLTGFGAPQRHGQRSFEHPLDDLKNTYGIRWNDDWGKYRGEDFGWRENFYHKPQVGLNHIWQLSPQTEIVSSAYFSIGRGGGTGDIGSVREFLIPNNTYGQENFDRIAAWNAGRGTLNSVFGELDPVSAVRYSMNGGDFETGQIASNENGGTIKRASMNEHEWYGFLSNVRHEINPNLTFSGGIDLRWYHGSHYRKAIDLLGAEYWFDDDNINEMDDQITYIDGTDTITESGNLVRPKTDAERLFGSVPDDEKIDYHNDEDINWYGAFGQLEYSTGDLSVFVSGAFNYTQMRRIDFFQKTPENNTTDWLNFIGGNVKAGANYNLNENNNVFVNVGYISRAPYFDALFPTFDNDAANEDAENEKVLGIEAGYGYNSRGLRLNVNGYYTQWSDKTEVQSARDPNNQTLFLNLLGVEALHMGIEVDAAFRIGSNFDVTAMGSFGNWEWQGTPNGVVTDDQQNVIRETTLYLDGVKVGDAAQTTIGVGAAYEIPTTGLSLDAQYLYYDNLYAAYDVADRDDEATAGQDPLKLPSYGLVDAGLTWEFNFMGQDSKLRVNVYNLFDELYVSEAFDTDGDLLDTRGWYGFGRTWNATFKLNF